MKVNRFFKTDGNGLWSSTSSSVLVIRMEVPYIDEEFSFGEMRLYFDENTWDVNRDGLIYTDKYFLKQVKNYINEVMPFNIDDVSYSEAGMQGHNYVSFDVGKKFLKFWVDLAVKNSQLVNQE